MTVERRGPNRRRDDAREALQQEMNSAAFGAAASAAVQQEHTKSQIELIWAELKWHKWLLLVVAGGIFGQYLGLAGTVAKAMPFGK